LLEVITCGRIVAFENFVNNWLGNCSQCTGLEVEGCVEPVCESLYDFPAITTPNFSPSTPQICGLP
jgi:hypothetical protein